MPRNLIAVYRSPHQASGAIDRLLAAGFRREHVGAVMHPELHEKHFGAKDPGKKAAGIESGLIGLAALVSAVPAVLIPGLGLVIAVPMFALLAAGALAAARPLERRVKGDGLEAADTEALRRAIDSGGVLVTVQVSEMSEQERAGMLLVEAGAQTISVVDQEIHEKPQPQARG